VNDFSSAEPPQAGPAQKLKKGGGNTRPSLNLEDKTFSRHSLTYNSYREDGFQTDAPSVWEH
jgi:hypothetical protein